MTDLTRYRVQFTGNGDLDEELERLQQQPLTMQQVVKACRTYCVRAKVTTDDGAVRWVEADGRWEPDEPTEPAHPTPNH
jgi:hypothetical protein